jgi:hypothetical protein
MHDDHESYLAKNVYTHIRYSTTVSVIIITHHAWEKQWQCTLRAGTVITHDILSAKQIKLNVHARGIVFSIVLTLTGVCYSLHTPS